MAATSAVDDDRWFLTRRTAERFYQVTSLLAPPCHVAWVLASKRGRSLSINRLLRFTWMSGGVGLMAGGIFEYLRSANSSEESIRRRRLECAYDSASLRADDHSRICQFLFAVLTPAFFWNRAHPANLILGGLGIGSSVGLMVHHGRTLAGDPPSKMAAPSLLASS